MQPATIFALALSALMLVAAALTADPAPPPAAPPAHLVR